MSSCTACGHQLGVGRFCTNCGAPVDTSTPDGTPVSNPGTGPAGGPADQGTPVPPVAATVPGDDWRTDTAERRVPRPAPDPRTPPTAVAPPPPPRFPLYADEVAGYAAPVETAPVPAPAPEPAPVPLVPDDDLGYDEEYVYDEDRRSPVLWILAAALVLVLVATGWWFLVRDDGTDRAADDSATGAASGSTAAAVEGVDVAGRASARAPSTAPPNEDVNGDQVSYDASNMLDGVPETAWRTPGDATGMSLTFTLREPTELHRVGLVNGYAKTSTDGQNRTFDWYLGNRRLVAVVWVFDDGTKVRQQLSETRELQTMDVDDVITGTVTLKLVRVSAPGDGTASRDFTAISEVSLVGEPS